MNVTLSPKIEQKVIDQVKSGRFATPEAVIEAAVSEFVDGELDDSLDGEDLAAIAEADAEIDRGEGMSLAEFDAAMAKQTRRP